MKRKFLGIVLVIAMLVTLFGGCGHKKPPIDEPVTPPSGDETNDKPPKNDEPITLKWAIWDMDITPYWGALKQGYESANDNVTLELTDLSSADYMTVLATELSGSGSDFDVVTIKDVPGYATLVSKNTLEPLDGYISKAGIDLDQYGGIDKQVSVGGSLYQLPFRNDFWIVYYNKDIFDRAEMDYPTNDMTFEEYDTIARQIADPTYGSQIYGTHYHTWRSAVQLFGVLDGKHTILEGNYNFFKQFYEMVIGQEDDGICRKFSDLSAEGLHYSAAFSSGDVAMMNMGSWYISTLISSLKSGEYDDSLCGNWGIVKYPHLEGVKPGSTLGTITGLSVTSVSKQKQAAFDFIEWVSGSEGAKIMAETGNFPALINEEVSAIIAGLDGFPTDAASKEALNISNLYLEVPYAENVSEINAILDTYHNSIMNREISIDEGIDKMDEEVEKLSKK